MWVVLVKNSIAAKKSHIRFSFNLTPAASGKLLGSIIQLQFSTPQNISFVWSRYSRSSRLSFVAMMQSNEHWNADNLSAPSQTVIRVTRIRSSSP